jgi:hypothetical protein
MPHPFLSFPISEEPENLRHYNTQLLYFLCVSRPRREECSSLETALATRTLEWSTWPG